MSSDGKKKRTIKLRKPRVCSLPHCRAKRGKDISLFCFPKDEVLRREWAKELKFEREIAKYSFVCNQHFAEKDLIARPDGEWLRRRLRKGALPSKNLPEFPIVDGNRKKVYYNAPELDSPGAAMLRNSRDSPIATTSCTPIREEKREECRVCLRLAPQSCTTNIFKKWTANFLTAPSTIAAELGKLANVEIVEDANPKHICDSCLFLFRRSLKFVIDVQNSENVLKKRFIQLEVPPTSNKTWPQPIQVEKNINEEVLGKSADVEIKQEVVSEDEYDPFNTNEEDRQDAQMEIKVEPEEITEPSFPIKVTVNGTISEDQLDAISSMTNGFEVYENEEYLEAMSIKEEPTSDEEVQGDLPLDCMLCAKGFRTTSGLKAHVVTDHNYKTVKRKSGNNNSPRCGKTRRSSSDSQPSDKKRQYICSMCHRVFVTSTDLRVHETCHSKFFCFACNARFDTFKEVTRHRQRCKVKPQTVKLKTLSDVMKARAKLALLKVNVEPQCSAGSDDHKDNILLQIFKTGESTEKANNISEVVEKATGLEKKKEQNVAIKQEKDDEDEKYYKIEAELRIALGITDNEDLKEKSKSTDKKVKEEIIEDARKSPESLIDSKYDTKETEIPQTEKVSKTAESVKMEKIEIEVKRIDINKEVQLEVEHMQDSETNSIAPSETNSDYTDTTRDQDGEIDATDSDFTDSMKEKDLVNNENEEQSKSEVCDMITGEKSDVKSNTFVIERIEEIL